MTPEEAKRQTEDDLANAAELVGHDPQDTRESVAMIIERYESYLDRETEYELTEGE